MQPSTAEYWHIGAMTMRLRNCLLRMVSGVNKAGWAIICLPTY